MRCLNSAPLIEECIFQNNTAGFHGGGIHATSSRGMRVKNCTFIANSAGSGAGLSFSGARHCIVDSCQFISNKGYGIGGGLEINSCSLMIVNNSIFEKNTAGDGGGIGLSPSTNVTIYNCVIKNNRADFGGGLSNISSEITIKDCIISHNNAATWGGGLHCLHGTISATNTTIEDNEALEQGGAINCIEGTGKLDSCTINNNSITLIEKNGITPGVGGIYIEQSLFKINNSQITNNGYGVFHHIEKGRPSQNTDARNNWWGYNSGPYQSNSNPNGVGDSVSEKVDFIPWNQSNGIATATPIYHPTNVRIIFNGAISKSINFSLSPNTSQNIKLSFYDLQGRVITSCIRSISPGKHDTVHMNEFAVPRSQKIFLVRIQAR